MRDALEVVELGYDLSSVPQDWLGRIATEIYDQLGGRLGMQSFSYDVTPERRMRIRETLMIGMPDGMAENMVPVLEQLPPEFVRKTFVICNALTQSQLDADTLEMIRPTNEMLEQSFGWRDILIVGGMDPSGHGAYFGLGLPEKTRLPARMLRKWARVAVHLATARRLRGRLAAAEIASPESADAILTPGGRVEHVQEEAHPAQAREQLKDAVRTTERARGRLRRSEPEQAVELWRGLVSGRWTLVDHFESDGKRYVLARRNDVRVGGLASLTLRERQAVAYAALGHTNKLIAYEMGLSASTVGVLLHRAGRKLGTSTREALVAAYQASRGSPDE
jgi:DNA-binding CsgD family transcriptional regulator